MAIFLSFLAAVSFGVADFSGGTASRQIRSIQVLALSHFVGFVLVVVAAVIWRSPFDLVDFGIGALSGVVGGAGIILFYRALARGAMSVVPPVVGVISSAVPSAWSAVLGEPLPAKVWLGVVVALAGVGLVSRSMQLQTASTSGVVLAEAVAAGLSFGVFFVLVDLASSDSAPWPIVGARFVTGIGLTSILVFSGRVKIAEIASLQSKSLFVYIALAGILDTAANVMFLLASNLGNLAVVSVITGMYPVVTVALARAVDKERLQRAQLVGLLLILVATVLLVG